MARELYLSNYGNPPDNPAPGASTALEKRATENWRNPDWQRLWLTLEAQPWRSLVVIPAGEGAPLDLALNVAVSLSRTGMTHLGAPIQVADGVQVGLNQLAGFLGDVQSCNAQGYRVIIGLPPLLTNPTAASIAKAADAAVLCVLLGLMPAAHGRQTIKLVGASRFIGSIIIHPETLRPPP